MARISNYDDDATVSGTDKVIGTDSSTTFTKNFRVIDLAEFFFSSLSGDVSVDSSGVVSVSSVGTLGSNSGNYVATLTARNGITSSGATSGATVNHILDVNSTQTHITSILNAGLCIGRDSDNKICFTTDNEIRLTVNGVLDLILAENALTPGSNDGTALGTTSLMWSDLFLASGAIINFNNGNLTLTHSSNALTLSGSDKLQFGDDATYIHQSADSVLDLVSDGELELNATTEVEINTALVDVNASGAVTIDAGGNSNITVTGSLDVDASAALTIDSATSIGIGTSADKPIDIDSTTLDIDASDAVTIDGTSISIDGNTASNLTVTGSGESLTLEATGGGTQQVVINSAGTSTSAVDINATAGGIDIDASGALAIDSATSISIGTNADKPVTIDSTTFALDAASTVVVDGTGVSIDGTLDSNLTVDGSGQDLALKAIGGGTQVLSLDSAGTGTNAIDINATGGGVDIVAAANVSMLAATSFVAQGNNSATFGDDTEQIAYDGSGNLDIDAVAIDLDSSGAINILAAGNASDITIKTEHVAGTSFHLDANSDVGSIVDIDAGILNIASDGLTSMLSASTFDIDAAGAVTIDGSAITIGADDSGVAISIGHTTSETTVNDNLNVTGEFKINAGDQIITFPTARGNNNQVLKTNGSGVLSFTDPSSGVTVADSTANTDFPIVFHDESNNLLDDTNAFEYNPSTGLLTVNKLTPKTNAAGDIGSSTVAYNDLFLSNGGVIEFIQGTGNRSQITHIDGGVDGNGDRLDGSLRISSKTKLEFNDSAVYIASLADGHLDLVSDTEVQIVSPSLNFDGAANISGNLVLGSGLSVGGHNVTDIDDNTSLGTSDLKLATQKAIKTYVDAQVDSADTLGELNDVILTSAANHSMLLYNGSEWIDNVMSGDATMANTGVITVGILNQSTTGSAATLTTARNFSLTGNVTASAVSFDGSGNVALSTSLAANTVDSSELVDGSIDTSHIGDDQVTGAKIADDTIDSNHYAAGSIDNEHIADNAINSEHYAAGSIDNEHLASNSVNSSNYVDASIDTEHLSSGCTAPKVTVTAYTSGTFPIVLHNDSNQLFDDTSNFQFKKTNSTISSTNDNQFTLTLGETADYAHYLHGGNIDFKSGATISTHDAGIYIMGNAYYKLVSGNGSFVKKISAPSEVLKLRDQELTLSVHTSNGSAGGSMTLTEVFSVTAAGNLTVTGELDGATLDISGNADINGNLTGVNAFTASGKIQGAEIEGTSLDINGNADISGNLAGVDNLTMSGILDITNTTDSTNDSGDTGALRCEGGASINGKIYADGNVTAPNFVVASDRRLKSEIEPIKEGLEVIKQFTSYNYIKRGEKESGFIAQEVQKVLPHTVYENSDGMLSMSDRGVVAHMHKAILELEKRLISIEEKLK